MRPNRIYKYNFWNLHSSCLAKIESRFLARYAQQTRRWRYSRCVLSFTKAPQGGFGAVDVCIHPILLPETGDGSIINHPDQVNTPPVPVPVKLAAPRRQPLSPRRRARGLHCRILGRQSARESLPSPRFSGRYSHRQVRRRNSISKTRNKKIPIKIQWEGKDYTITSL